MFLSRKKQEQIDKRLAREKLKRTEEGLIRKGDMLYMPEGVDLKFVPIEVMRTADEQHNALLEQPWYVTTESNRVVVMAQYIHDNCQELIKKIPQRCKEFDLLGQPGNHGDDFSASFETFTACGIGRDEMRESTRVYGCAGIPPRRRGTLRRAACANITLADYCTGGGKTIMAILAGLTDLRPELWEG